MKKLSARNLPELAPDPHTENARLVEDANGALLYLNETEDFTVSITIGAEQLSDPRWPALLTRLLPLTTGKQP